MAHQCTAREQQVRTCGIETLVNKEVLLLPAKVRGHLLHLRVKIMAHLRSSHIHGMQCTQQRCLIVQRLAAV